MLAYVPAHTSVDSWWGPVICGVFVVLMALSPVNSKGYTRLVKWRGVALMIAFGGLWALYVATR